LHRDYGIGLFGVGRSRSWTSETSASARTVGKPVG
jgi:hypothetical protein